MTTAANSVVDRPLPAATGDRVRVLTALLLASALLAWGAANAWPFFADDAYISLRYSQRLLDGHGLTWNDGERVEGYSNLLWTLLCAGLGALGLDLVTAARALGIACMLGTVALLARRFRSTWAGALTAPLLAAMPAMPVWTIGGLELPLVWLATTAGLLQTERALAGERTSRALLTAGACFAAACVTRPDAPLFLAFAAVAVWLRGGARARSLAALLAVPALAIGAQLAFRLAYYGDYVPNTARVKLGFRWDLLQGGIDYLSWALPAQLGVAVPAVVVAVAAARASVARRAATLLLLALLGWLAFLAVRGNVGFTFRDWPWLAVPLLPLLLLCALVGGRLAPVHRTFALLLAAIAVAWAAYLASVGGDIFPGWRLLSPLLPPAAILAGLGFEAAARMPGCARLAAATALLAIATARTAAHFDGETARAHAERWEIDYENAANTLAAAFGARQPLMAVNAAGALCYFSRFPSLDMYGLNDRTIARDPYPSEHALSRGALGAAHRRGRPEYLLARAPDLINFDSMPFPGDEAGRALLGDPRFERDYRCVWIRCADATLLDPAFGEFLLPFWVRLEGRVGVERSSDGARVTVPAWLLASYRHPADMTTAEPAEPQAKARWLQQATAAAAWLQRPAVARPDGGRMVLEARRGELHALRGLRLAAGAWQATLEPAVPGCTLELTVDDDAGSALPQREGAFVVDDAHATGVQLRLRIDAAAARPVRATAIVLQRR